MNVLLLEDDPHLAKAMRLALEADGFGVTWFRTVAEARHAIPPIGFRVLLCDYELRDPSTLEPPTGLDFLTEVERATFLGLSRWTTILWSGLDRSREIAASGLKIDHVLPKTQTDEVLDVIRQAATK